MDETFGIYNFFPLFRSRKSMKLFYMSLQVPDIQPVKHIGENDMYIELDKLSLDDAMFKKREYTMYGGLE